MLLDLLLTAYLVGYMIALGIVIMYQGKEFENKQYWYIASEVLFIPLLSWIIVGIQLVGIEWRDK